MSDPQQKVNSSFIEKPKIRRYFYAGTILCFLLLAIALSINYVKSLDQEYSKKIEQLSNSILNEKKILLHSSVDQVIYLIEAEKKGFFAQEVNQNKNVKELDSLFKEHIKPIIRSLRLESDGYVWINQINHWEGGDNYGIRFVHANLPHTEGSFLSTNTQDKRGNKPYLIELEGMKKSGELFYDYYFKEMKSEKISHKMSYAKLYKPYNWVVATGVYLDEVDQLIKSETEEMHSTHAEQLFYSFIITALVIFLAMLILVFVEKQISKLIDNYDAKNRRYTRKILLEKARTEKALEEVKQLKGLLPICSHCKKIRDDGGYWNQIEEYVEAHSDASFSHGVCPSCMDELYGKEDWFKPMAVDEEKLGK